MERRKQRQETNLLRPVMEVTRMPCKELHTHYSSIVIKALGRGVGLTHQFLKAACNFLNNIMKNYKERREPKIFCKDGKLKRQRRTLGQCNIVDHRKLVSLINNEEKQTEVGL